MTGPENRRTWPLDGLIYCGYCDQQMPGMLRELGLRVYRCPLPCERSTASADKLELMAYQTAVTAIPALLKASGQVQRVALFAETYRQVVVHGDVDDVRFIGYPN